MTRKENFGKSELGEGKKHVIVDYSSTNIAKPFHIGHIRSTVIGDSLKRIYDFLGFNTIALITLETMELNLECLSMHTRHGAAKKKLRMTQFLNS